MSKLDWSLIMSDEELIKLYHSSSSLEKLADKIGVHKRTLSTKLKSLGVKMRGKFGRVG